MRSICKCHHSAQLIIDAHTLPRPDRVGGHDKVLMATDKIAQMWPIGEHCCRFQKSPAQTSEVACTASPTLDGAPLPKLQRDESMSIPSMTNF